LAVSDFSSSGGGDTAAARLARDVSALQAALLARLREELGDVDAEAFAAVAQELAEHFGSITAAAIRNLSGSAPAGGRGTAAGLNGYRHEAEAAPERHPSLFRPGHMRRRLEQLLEAHHRYEQTFAIVVFDVDGPGSRNGDVGEGRDTVLTVVGTALRDSVRLLDETFRLEEEALCVLAPNQNTVGGVQMAERLLRRLYELEEAGGMRIGIFAGVVCCPEHGEDAEQLLRKADEAMWRARAVGQPIGVGGLQPVQDR
jgi:diguanylate cyclase (GGDEF)-like protein